MRRRRERLQSKKWVRAGNPPCETSPYLPVDPLRGGETRAMFVARFLRRSGIASERETSGGRPVRGTCPLRGVGMGHGIALRFLLAPRRTQRNRSGYTKCSFLLRCWNGTTQTAFNQEQQPNMRTRRTWRRRQRQRASTSSRRNRVNLACSSLR